MNNVILIYSDDLKQLDFGSDHPMRGDRYGKALEEFKKLKLLNNLTMGKPELVLTDIISFFNTSDYIYKVRDVTNTGCGYFGEEVPGFKGIYDVALLSVSASVNAANRVCSMF